jgi:DNA repair exonuclease SbcCD ATPase subunit
VFGHNWQGKSSIVDAIGFALFGIDVFPKRVVGTAVRAEHLVNEDTAEGGVELCFEVNGIPYSLARTLPDRGVTFTNNGHVVASGIRTVTEKLIALIGVDAKLFQNIFYSDQDELRRSLEFSPEERRVFVEHLMGVEEWKTKVDELRSARRSLEKFLDDLSSGRLGVFLNHVEELEQDIELKNEQVGELQNSIRLRQAQAPNDLGTLRRTESASQNRLAVLQDQQLETETKLQMDEFLRTGVQKGKCPTCTQMIPPALRKSRLAALAASIAALRRKLTAISRQLDKQEVVFENADFTSSYETLSEIREMKGRQEILIAELARGRERLKRLRRQAKAFGKKPQQVEQTKSEIAFLEKLEQTIQQFRRSLRGRLVQQLAVGMNDFLARFHDGDNDTAVKIDEDLNVSVELHGREVPIFNLSGAAKDILALSLRYGLLRVAARGVNFLVLDEPTRHMDPGNCRKLKALFNDLLDRQLIVVTVNSEFSDAAGRHFRICKDDTLHSVVGETW